MLFLARTAMGLQFQSVAAVSPLLVEALGLDFALLGVLIGAWMLPGVFVAIPGGLLGRRFGDKQVVMAGLALMAAGSFAIAAAESYGVALAGRVVSGAGAVVLNVLLAKMVADWFHERELQTAMALLVASWPIGIGIALVALAPLAAASSWTAAMQAPAWACLAALVLVGGIYRKPAAAEGEARGPAWLLGRRDLAIALISGTIWTLFNVAYILVVSFAPALLAADGVDPARAALVTSAATWGLILTVPAGGYLADRSGRGNALMLGALVAMVFLLPLVLVVPWPVGALFVFGLITGIPGGVIAALPGRALSAGGRYLGMGIFFTLYYVGMALLPGIAGWLRERLALDAAPLAFAALLAALAAALVVLFRRVEENK